MEHKQHKCDREWCTVCRNKQRHCTTCGARDREQPTHCPGRPMTEQEKDAVYHRDLDFRDGDWGDGLI